MKYFLSIDDYSPDNYKTAKLLLKYNLQATFFINLEANGDRRTPKEQVKILSEMGFDIGCHSIEHSILKDMSKLDQDLNIYYARDMLEQITGKNIDWFCPVKGKYNDLIIQKVLDAGFKYIRTVDVMDMSPIKLGLNKTTIHAYPRKEYKEKGDNMTWYNLAKTLIESNTKDSCFKMWWHSWEIDKFQAWNQLEEVLKKIASRGASNVS